MGVWNWLGGDRIEQGEAAVPVPGPHEVLLRVRAVGICGTDLHIVRGVIKGPVPPIALGHEIAGDVVACGAGVALLKVGDRCVVDPGIGCGRCEWCRTGQKTYCPQAQQLGITVPGGWQRYLKVPEENCYVLPAQVKHREATLAEPLFTVLGGLDKVQIKAGEAVLVIGGGPAGLLFAYLAQQISSVPVTLAGTRRRRLELARHWGIGRVINVAERPLEEALAGQEFPVVIEAVGSAQTMQQAVTMAAPRGRVLLFGLRGETSLPIDVTRVVMRDLSLLGTTDNPVVWPRVRSLIAGGMLPLGDMVTQVYAFSRLPEAVAWALEHPEETVKVVVSSEDDSGGLP